MKSIELKKYFRNFILKNVEEMDKILNIILFQDINNVSKKRGLKELPLSLYKENPALNWLLNSVNFIL